MQPEWRIAPGTPAGVAAYLPTSWNDTYLPRWISGDGSRVFFDSIEPLLPWDTNGKQDVYEWERAGAGGCPPETAGGGCIYLLSGGVNESASSLLDANSDGDDVFIITSAQLLPKDRNENFDVYDARVGGMPRAAPSECEGVACQGNSPVPPVFANPSSVIFSGAGNLTPGAPSGKPTPKVLTRAQRLAAALKACRRRSRVAEARAGRVPGASQKAVWAQLEGEQAREAEQGALAIVGTGAQHRRSCARCAPCAPCASRQGSGRPSPLARWTSPPSQQPVPPTGFGFASLEASLTQAPPLGIAAKHTRTSRQAGRIAPLRGHRHLRTQQGNERQCAFPGRWRSAEH